MVTIAHYSRLEEAQQDAARLASRGINVAIVHQGAGGGMIPGIGTSIELQIDPKDLDKLAENEEDIAEQITHERPYHCPDCQSKNYTARQPFSEIFEGFFRVISRLRPAVDDYMHFKCRDCGCHFRIRV